MQLQAERYADTIVLTITDDEHVIEIPMRVEVARNVGMMLVHRASGLGDALLTPEALTGGAS